MGTYNQDRQARQSPQSQGQMGTKLFPRQTKRQLTNWFTCFHNTWISNELPHGSQTGMESFPPWSPNSILTRIILWYAPWCCVSITTRSRSSTIFCCWIKESCIQYEWCTTTVVEYPWQGTVQSWYGSLRELTDAVMYNTQWIRVRELGTKETLHSVKTRTTSQSNRVSGLKQMMHMTGCWIPLQTLQPQKNRGRNY